MSNKLPERIILPLGELKRIGIFKEFCKSEIFDEEGIISRVADDAMFSFDSYLLPDGYKYEVPEGYIIKGFND